LLLEFASDPAALPDSWPMYWHPDVDTSRGSAANHARKPYDAAVNARPNKAPWTPVLLDALKTIDTLAT
jgi:hypothetical protein